MSNQTNTELLELAKDHQEYWTGTIWEKAIQRMIDTNDLDALKELLIKSAIEMGRESQEHFNNYDLIGDNDVY